jgi:hypothetical protein
VRVCVDGCVFLTLFIASSPLRWPPTALRRCRLEAMIPP